MGCNEKSERESNTGPESIGSFFPPGCVVRAMDVRVGQRGRRLGPWGNAMLQKKVEECIPVKYHVKGYRHTLFHESFVLFCLKHVALFYKLKVYGNPALGKMIGDIFSTAFAHFMSLCHSLVILTVNQTSFFFF